MSDYLVMQDFIGFTYNGYHSSQLGIYRTSNSSRFDDDITATMADKTAEVPGGNGQYYFGTTFTNKTFNVPFVFDNLTEDKLRTIKKIFSGDGIHDLIFDETPFKAWSAKVTGSATMKHLCFEENGQRIYKGEGSITFTCYYPYAHTPTKLWIKEYNNTTQKIEFKYTTRDGRNPWNYDPSIYISKDEWIESSGLSKYDVDNQSSYDSGVKTQNLGDLPSHFEVKKTGSISSNSKLLVRGKQITIKEACSDLKWNSKTGIVTGTVNGTEKIISCDGELIRTLPCADSPPQENLDRAFYPNINTTFIRQTTGTHKYFEKKGFNENKELAFEVKLSSSTTLGKIKVHLNAWQSDGQKIILGWDIYKKASDYSTTIQQSPLASGDFTHTTTAVEAFDLIIDVADKKITNCTVILVLRLKYNSKTGNITPVTVDSTDITGSFASGNGFSDQCVYLNGVMTDKGYQYLSIDIAKLTAEPTATIDFQYWYR